MNKIYRFLSQNGNIKKLIEYFLKYQLLYILYNFFGMNNPFKTSVLSHAAIFTELNIKKSW